MKKFKFIVTILTLSFFSVHVLAHGPSRQKVSEKIVINASPQKVWGIVSNFKQFDWNNNIKSTIADNNQVGSERTLEFTNGSLVKQKLEKTDKEKMMVSWRIVETDNKVLPVNSYSAKIFIRNNDDGSSSVNYKAGFYRGFMGNDPPEELNDQNSKKKVQEFIQDSLKGLKKVAEKN